MESVFCVITYPDRTGFNTMATSVFAAAANALEWVEVHRRDSERRGSFAMTKSCGSAWEWCQTAGIACESEGFEQALGRPTGRAGARRALEE